MEGKTAGKIIAAIVAVLLALFVLGSALGLVLDRALKDDAQNVGLFRVYTAGADMPQSVVNSFAVGSPTYRVATGADLQNGFLAGAHNPRPGWARVGDSSAPGSITGCPGGNQSPISSAPTGLWVVGPKPSVGDPLPAELAALVPAGCPAVAFTPAIAAPNQVPVAGSPPPPGCLGVDPWNDGGCAAFGGESAPYSYRGARG